MTVLSERAEPRQPTWKIVVKVLLVLVLLYFFLGGMAMMGEGLKTLGKNPDYDKHATEGAKSLEYRPVVYRVFAYADNPLVGLFVGLLATSIFQSSSFTTSFTVALVVTTPLALHQAIFIIMGANIGTSVTNAGVSFTQIRRREEFERAYGAAIVHDFFNVLTVCVLLPIEYVVLRVTGRGLLERAASYLAHGFYSGMPTGEEPTNALKEAVAPLVTATSGLLGSVFGLELVTASIILAILGVVTLFVALLLMTKVLHSLVMKPVERFLDRVLFRNDFTAFAVGLILTSIVQSSSVTTSLLVPLTGAGLLTLRQIYPYTLGANIGTTLTAIIASFATAADTPAQAQVGVALAFSHMLFNVTGTAIWYPLRRVPIGLALWWAGVCARTKRYAVLHILLFFFLLPVVVLVIEWWFR
jgi:sodium-dependent phosphate cotransporter